MNKIFGIERLPKEYNSKEFDDIISLFDKVLSLEIKRISDDLDLYLSLKSSNNNIIDLCFSQVSDLEISNLTLPDFETTILHIRDISSYQLEEVNWEISNYEDFNLNFRCKSIELMSHKLLS